MSRPIRRIGIALAVLGASALAVVLVRDPWTRAWIKGRTVHVLDRRSELDAQTLRLLFGEHIEDGFRYDPVAHLLPLADQEKSWPWAEHPAGRFVIHTNNLGFREDEPTSPEKHGPRILVAGDSHTSGLVDNSESFANLLEARLGQDPERRGLEVLNAGVAFTGPQSYLGVLRKYLFLDPDVFIAVLFTGNDFWNDLNVQYYLDGWSPPGGDAPYLERIRAASERWRGPVSQGFNQLFRWKQFPWEPDLALEAVVDSFTKMRDLCAENGVAFLTVVLPTKMDVEPEDDSETQTGVRAFLELGPEEADVNRELGARFTAAMEAARIRCLDPLEALRGAPHPLYWRSDYHLGRAGHALLAELIARELRGWWR